MEPGPAYPRVLILGPTFDQVTGGGITLTNLFAGWPADRLALASFDPCSVEPAPADLQYRLGGAERPWIPLLRFAGAIDRADGGPATENVRGGVGGPSAALSSQVPAGPLGQVRPLVKKGFHLLARSLGSEEVLRPMAASVRLIAWARDFRPDLLYTQLGDLGVCRLAMGMAAALGVPTAIHMMDDWPVAIYTRGLLGRRLERETDAAMRRLVGRAAACIAISQAMADEYGARYGRQWSYFHNPVDPARWRAADAAARSSADAREFALVYSGRIGPGIEASVLDVCRAVAGLRRQGKRVRLDLHSPHFERSNDPRFAGIDGVHLHGAIPDADMAATLGAANALVLPFDFHGDAAAFARLSFPTKAPAYEATGVPILVYAPAGHAVAADAATRGWGYVVGEPDLDKLMEAVARLMQDGALRAELSRRALADVVERHEAGAVRARFAATLAEAARNRG
jgi:glycosyltransferase involved in cell wall biosynthesis